MFGALFAQNTNFVTDNLYAATSTHYFAFAHIDSAGSDTATIATAGTWYQMQGTMDTHLLGFTKFADGGITIKSAGF